MILDRKVCHVGGRSEDEKAEFWGILDDSIPQNKFSSRILSMLDDSIERILEENLLINKRKTGEKKI